MTKIKKTTTPENTVAEKAFELVPLTTMERIALVRKSVGVLPRNGHAVKYNYVTLDDLYASIETPLAEQNLGIVSKIIKDTVHVALKDNSGESLVTSEIPLIGVQSMPDLGGAVTYAIRYAIATMLGLSITTDTDNVFEKSPTPRPESDEVTVTPTGVFDTAMSLIKTAGSQQVLGRLLNRVNEHEELTNDERGSLIKAIDKKAGELQKV